MEDFYDLTSRMPPHDLTEVAVQLCQRKSTAADIGAGSGPDTKLLVRTFKSVVAVEPERKGVQYLQRIAAQCNNLVVVNASAQSWLLTVHPGTFDFVVSMDVLPFIGGQLFTSVWSMIASSMARGGIFCGQVFGIEDDYATESIPMTFLTSEKLQFLINEHGFKVVWMMERKIVLQNWTKRHVFQFILRKK